MIDLSGTINRARNQTAAGQHRIDRAGRQLFFFNDTAATEIYALSLHDALPICAGRRQRELLLAVGTEGNDFGCSRRKHRGGSRGAERERGSRQSQCHVVRSEERRGGKEGRSRWLTYH